MNVKIGEIYRRSWGYDQTNVDYFQVVALKAKTVVIRPISYAQVPDSGGFMSCNVVPVKDKFIDSELPRTVRVSVGHKGEPVLTVGKKQWAYLVPQNADGTYPHSYCSWYAWCAKTATARTRHRKKSKVGSALRATSSSTT